MGGLFLRRPRRGKQTGCPTYVLKQTPQQPQWACPCRGLSPLPYRFFDANFAHQRRTVRSMAPEARLFEPISGLHNSIVRCRYPHDFNKCGARVRLPQRCQRATLAWPYTLHSSLPSAGHIDHCGRLSPLDGRRDDATDNATKHHQLLTEKNRSLACWLWFASALAPAPWSGLWLCWPLRSGAPPPAVRPH